MLTVVAGQTAGQGPELGGVTASLTAAGEEPVGGEEALSLQLALSTGGFMSAFSRALLVVLVMKLLGGWVSAI